jgi:hypothetical protein
MCREKSKRAGMAVHSCNPSTREAEEEDPEFEASPELPSKNSLKRKIAQFGILSSGLLGRGLWARGREIQWSQTVWWGSGISS